MLSCFCVLFLRTNVLDVSINVPVQALSGIPSHSTPGTKIKIDPFFIGRHRVLPINVFRPDFVGDAVSLHPRNKIKMDPFFVGRHNVLPLFCPYVLIFSCSYGSSGGARNRLPFAARSVCGIAGSMTWVLNIVATATMRSLYQSINQPINQPTNRSKSVRAIPVSPTPTKANKVYSTCHSSLVHSLPPT